MRVFIWRPPVQCTISVDWALAKMQQKNAAHLCCLNCHGANASLGLIYRKEGEVLQRMKTKEQFSNRRAYAAD